FLHSLGLRTLGLGLRFGFDLLREGLEATRVQLVLLLEEGLGALRDGRAVRRLAHRLKALEAGDAPRVATQLVLDPRVLRGLAVLLLELLAALLGALLAVLGPLLVLLGELLLGRLALLRAHALALATSLLE